MTDILRHILQMSLYGSIAILCVLIFRAVFCKLPKRVTCTFWAVAALRLLCPYNFGLKWSPASIWNKVSASGTRAASDAPSTIASAPRGIVHRTVSTVYNAAQPASTGTAGRAAVTGTSTPPAAGTPAIDLLTAATVVWLTVAVVLISIVIYKAIVTRRRLSGGKLQADGAFTSEKIAVPFVSGILSPRVFVPEVMGEKERSYILLHEQTHIRYLDHVTKMVGVVAVCIHWFNPLVWLAFILFSRDLEMRVDETVIEILGEDIRKDYCLSLVSFARTPLIYKVLNTAFSGRSFGGTEVKMRIRNLINYRKVPAGLGAIVTITAIGTTTILSACGASSAPNTGSLGLEADATVLDITADTSDETSAEADVTSSGDPSFAIDEYDCIEAAISELSIYAYDTSSDLVTDYGDWQDISFSSIADEVRVDPDHYTTESIRDAADYYTQQGCNLYDLDMIHTRMGGIGYNEGFVASGSSNDGYDIYVVERTEPGNSGVLTFYTDNSGRRVDITTDNPSEGFLLLTGYIDTTTDNPSEDADGSAVCSTCVTVWALDNETTKILYTFAPVSADELPPELGTYTTVEDGMVIVYSNNTADVVTVDESAEESAAESADESAEESAAESVDVSADESMAPAESGTLDAGQTVADVAVDMLGTPYVWGAESAEAVDASGLVVYCYSQVGIELPHYSEDLTEVGIEVPVEDIRPGDIVCWTSEGLDDEYCHHVAIYVGDGQVVNARGEQDGVCYDDLDLHPIVTIRRVVE